jgi:hypothetical protein
MESGSKELSEKMAREEEQRRKEAMEMKERLETDKKQQVTKFPEKFQLEIFFGMLKKQTKNNR